MLPLPSELSERDTFHVELKRHPACIPSYDAGIAGQWVSPGRSRCAPEKATIMKNLRTMPVTSVTLASVNAGTSSHILCRAPTPAQHAMVAHSIRLFSASSAQDCPALEHAVCKKLCVKVALERALLTWSGLSRRPSWWCSLKKVRLAK